MELNDKGQLVRRQRSGDIVRTAAKKLRLAEKALGPEHVDVAKWLVTLARLYAEEGEHALSEPLYKRSLDIRLKALGAGHPDVAESLIGLGAACREQGRYAEAEPLLRRALAIRGETIGPQHPDVEEAVVHLALLCQKQGRDGEAEALYKRALAIAEQAFGPDDLRLAGLLQALAEIYRRQHRSKDAKSLDDRFAEVMVRALGFHSGDKSMAWENWATLNDALGLRGKAKACRKRAAAIRAERGVHAGRQSQRSTTSPPSANRVGAKTGGTSNNRASKKRVA
jgi:tetratricopeptide (TPR) repeat protein